MRKDNYNYGVSSGKNQNGAGKNFNGSPNNKWFVVLKVLFVLLIISAVSSFLLSFFIDEVKNGNVARIKISGSIASDTSLGDVSSAEVVELIREAENNPQVRAILFEINSPGGSPVGSYEIADAIKQARDYNLTTVALVREVGASGAYWIASSTDYIIANPLSITGSIGVIGSYLEFSGLLTRYNVTYERLVAGKYKDVGSPFKKLNKDEKDKLQGEIDVIYEYFVGEVATNRNLPYDYVMNLSTGEVFTGINAEKLGLVDELGSFKEADAYLKMRLNTTHIEYVDYETQTTLIDVLTQVSSEFAFKIGSGIGYSLKKDDLLVRT